VDAFIIIIINVNIITLIIQNVHYKQRTNCIEKIVQCVQAIEQLCKLAKRWNYFIHLR